MNRCARSPLDDELPLVRCRRVGGRRILTLAILMITGCSKAPSAHQGPSVVRAGPAAASGIASQTNGSDWPGFLGPSRNGKSAEKGVPEHWPANAPAVLWHKEIGVGYSAPAISQGRMFHFARFDDVARLTCMDAVTGKTQWTCDYETDYSDMLGYNNGPRATPVVDGDRVYTFGAEGILQCVRVADGERLWKIDTMNKFNVVKNFFGVGSTPLVWNDLLLVNVGGSPPGGPADLYAGRGVVQADGAAVVAFDKKTGDLRWKTGDDLASYASPVVATIEGRDIIFMFARGGLLAIDPTEGKTLAQFPWRARILESVNASTPVVVGDEVFISETYELGSALVRFTGSEFQEIWTDRNRRRDRAMALHWNTPIEAGGYLYGSSGYHEPEAELRCVEWKTGKVMWRQPDLGRTSLLLIEDTLVCLSEDGTVRLVRATPDRYEELAQWEFQSEDGSSLLRNPAWAAPALAHGLLYVQGPDQLVCVQLIAPK